MFRQFLFEKKNCSISIWIKRSTPINLFWSTRRIKRRIYKNSRVDKRLCLVNKKDKGGKKFRAQREKKRTAREREREREGGAIAVSLAQYDADPI